MTAGEKLFVDVAGRTGEVVYGRTGEIIPVQILSPSLGPRTSPAPNRRSDPTYVSPFGPALNV
jgi:hypothetical protein